MPEVAALEDVQHAQNAIWAIPAASAFCVRCINTIVFCLAVVTALVWNCLVHDCNAGSMSCIGTLEHTDAGPESEMRFQPKGQNSCSEQLGELPTTGPNCTAACYALH